MVNHIFYLCKSHGSDNPNTLRMLETQQTKNLSYIMENDAKNIEKVFYF